MCGFLVCLVSLVSWVCGFFFFFALIQIDILKTTKERERDLFQSAVEHLLLEDFFSCNVLNSASTTKR